MCPIYLQIKSGLSLLLEEGGIKVNLASIVIPKEDEGVHEKGVAVTLYRLLSTAQKLSSDALNIELSANTEIVCWYYE